MHYLIIGGGIAGTTCAEELRKLDASCEITLLSEEHERLYSRVLLAPYVLGKVLREKIFLKKPEWYEKENIEFVPGTVAEKIDVKNKFVQASNGREYPFDALVIASGGEVKLMDQDGPQVSYLRTLSDADHLVELLQKYETGKVGILGGGFIALEYINIFAEKKIPAELYLRGDQLFGQALDPDSSAILKHAAQAAGISVLQKRDHIEIEEFALLGVGIGVAPDLALIKEAGIEINKGVKTNAFLQTNIPDIYAIGDVAEFDDLIVGRQRLVGTWLNAIMQARTVAKTITGNRSEFKLVSSYAAYCAGVDIIFIGDTDRNFVDRVEVHGSKESGGVKQLFYRGDILVGATLVNRNTERAEIVKRIDIRNL